MEIAGRDLECGKFHWAELILLQELLYEFTPLLIGCSFFVKPVCVSQQRRSGLPGS